MNPDILKLQSIINFSYKIVFFGGAGVSTESGIQDFRSVNGLYHQKYRYPPETIISHHFFEENPVDFFEFYNHKMLILDKEPNECHRKLVELERTGKLTMVITQNIDGLHYKAGSKKVCELHGSVLRNYCTRCGKFVSGEELKHTLETVSIPHCARCGAVVKPDVVLYEESLKNEDIETAIKAIEECDTLIVGGTSLVVYPAAGLIRHFKGKHLVLINLDETPFDNMATLIIRDKIGNVFSQLDIK